MNKLISISVTVIVLLFASTAMIGCSGSKNTATSTASAKEITNAIDSSQWQFVANQVSPQFGRTRQVNGLYNAARQNNKLVVYLPYFGRATAGADVFSTRGPLDFTSTDFTPIVQKQSAEEWRISIKPNDNREVRSMDFTFFANGSASLSVIMNNRSAISFTGRVEPVKK